MLQNMAHSLVRVERSPVVGNPLPSIISVAGLTAALGGLLAHQAHWAGQHVVAGLIGYAAVSAIIALAVGIGRGRVGFGIANQVPLLRAGLVCLVGGALLASAPSFLGWSLAALIAAALSLDAVDGWLARRLSLSSTFGARFDLEVDALLLLVLALLVWRADRVAGWVLAIGLVRYLFVMAGWLLPWLRRPLPPSRRRQAVCVQQGVTLLLCLLPPVSTALASLAAGLALSALLASFAADIIYLARTRAPIRDIPPLDRRTDWAILTPLRFHTRQADHPAAVRNPQVQPKRQCLEDIGLEPISPSRHHCQHGGGRSRCWRVAPERRRHHR
jgi:phosphatidylglycerophosphate synthase